MTSEARAALQGGTVIDLGAGYYADQAGNMLSEMGAARYIAVDRNDLCLPKEGKPSKNGSGFLEVELPPPPPSEARREFRSSRVLGDMLLYVATLEPQRVNFSLSGIDGWIIDNDQYHRMLIFEIDRVSQPGSLLFGAGSRALEFMRKMACLPARENFRSNFSVPCRSGEISGWREVARGSLRLSNSGVFIKDECLETPNRLPTERSR